MIERIQDYINGIPNAMHELTHKSHDDKIYVYSVNSISLLDPEYFKPVLIFSHKYIT